MSSLRVIIEGFNTIIPSAPKYLPKDYPDLKGKTVLITGCSAGLGKETAYLLLKQNATVIFANRNLEKTESTIIELKERISKENDVDGLSDKILNDRILKLIIDLSDLTTIKKGIEEQLLKDSRFSKLDILILNAGVMQPPNGSVTKQGYELQFGTNVIGHQLLLKLLKPYILKARTESFNPRVIFLASAAYLFAPENAGLTWNFKDASQSSTQLIYGQSKVSNIYQAFIFGQDHKDDGIISLSVHPGLLNTTLFRKLPKFIQYGSRFVFYNPKFGAYTELFAALNQEITVMDTGRYVGPWGQFREIVRDDVKAAFEDGTARKLWDYVENEIKLYC